MTHFSKFGLAQMLVRAVSEEGYTVPTAIQDQAIAPIMLARDVLGCAQTGTGKTAAFALPILHRLITGAVDKSRRGAALPRVLVLAPTRELAIQIGDSFATYGRHTALSRTVVFGGVSQFHQVRSLERGCDILVATPGRLIDLMEQRLVNLTEVGTFVLDEADRMLDMGFINPIRRIAAALPKPPKRQTLLFSATMPREIMHLADSLLHDPVKVSVAPVATTTALIEQSVYMVAKASKPALLRHLLAQTAIERALIFTRTKRGADHLTHHLNRSGIPADAIHGNKAQNYRQRALEGFRNGRTRVLVATDVAARGIDVDGITHVVNYDMPIEPESYVHRIGRTGRAGATGMAVSFCDSSERSLLLAVERLISKRVPTQRLPELPEIEAPVHGADESRPARKVVGHGHARSERSSSHSPRPVHATAGSASNGRPQHGSSSGRARPEQSSWRGRRGGMKRGAGGRRTVGGRRGARA